MRATWVAGLVVLVACGGGEEDVAPTVTRFAADKAKVGAGDRVTLAWEVSGAAEVTIAGPDGPVVTDDPRASGTAQSGPIAADATFTLTARSAGGKIARATAEVKIDTALARITRFVAEPPSIRPNATSTLSWSISGNTVASVKLFAPGDRVIYMGSEKNGRQPVKPSETTAYRLVAATGSETLTASVTVTVMPEPPRILYLNAIPNPAVRGTNGRIAWGTAGADEVQLSRDGRVVRPWTGDSAAMGFTGFPFDTERSVFKLEARNRFGTVSQEVTVTTAAAVSIDQFTVTPARFTGTSTAVTITWATTAAETVRLLANGAMAAGFPGTASGTFTMTLTTSTELTLVATNPSGERRSTARVERTIPFPVRVVAGDRIDTRPVEGARVRVERTGRAQGPFAEGTTDATGVATLQLDASAYPVDVTAALAGASAVSIVGLDAPPADPINLTGAPVAPMMEADIGGTILGKQSAMNRVVIDAYLFNTVATTDADFMTIYLNGVGSSGVPLKLVAYELDGQDNAINFTTSATLARDGSAHRVELRFPSPPVPPAMTTVDVELPAAGLFPGAPPQMLQAQVIDLHDASELAYAYVGTSQAMMRSPTQIEWTMRSWTTGLGPTIGQLAARGATLQLVAQQHQLGGMQSLRIAEVRSATFPPPMTRLLDMNLDVDAPGYDALAVNIGEGVGTVAKWRVFFPAQTRIQNGRIPRLPSTVTLADLGLNAANVTSVGFLFLEMERGAPWSEPTLFQSTRNVRYQLGTAYSSYSLAGL